MNSVSSNDVGSMHCKFDKYCFNEMLYLQKGAYSMGSPVMIMLLKGKIDPELNSPHGLQQFIRLFGLQYDVRVCFSEQPVNNK